MKTGWGGGKGGKGILPREWGVGAEDTRSGQKVGLFVAFLLLPLFHKCFRSKSRVTAQLEPGQQRMWEARAGPKKQPLPMNERPPST